ncbi:MAG: hypothetical protein JNL74_11680, partial [Fibrobacteres bacterium]|nr:hypothetical protein [Fibrobacterota bacterium]
MANKRIVSQNSGNGEPKSYLLQKVLTAALVIYLSLYAYHNREWFQNIPEKKVVEKSVANTPKEAKNKKGMAVPLPDKGAKDGPGVIARIKAVFAKPPKIDERDTVLLNGALDTFYAEIGSDPAAVKRKIIN